MNHDKITINDEAAAPAAGFRGGMSGSTLKLIAIITMLIDHTGAAILERTPLILIPGVYYLDVVLRIIGRIAFPIFCFLLVEGILHTRSVSKYMLRLFLFAIISELPFDLALSGELEFGHQNVFFTLLLGMIAIVVIRYISKHKEWNETLRTVMTAGTIVICMGAAEWLRTDYGMVGVCVILILYLFRKQKAIKSVFAMVMLVSTSMIEASAVISFLLLMLYNGKRGIKIKYLFYWFYPVHLLILYAIAHYCFPW